MVQIDHNFRIQMVMHHHLLVPLRPKIELRIMVRNPQQGVHMHKIVWNKEIVSLHPMPSVVGITLAFFTKARWLLQV